MECGILRIKQITAGGISHIGGEEDRLHGNERNGDIDVERSRLNMSAYREPEQQTLYRAWQDKCAELGVSVQRKGQTAMEQAVITASPDFFARLGWDKEAAKNWTPDDIPPEIMKYFNDASDWAEQYFGAKNIISATVHFDETTPHMHIDYIPAVESSKRRKDVYARDADGKLVRDAKGHAVRARDENGKVIYAYEDAPARLSRTDFWQQRGGRQSYRKMQDQFYEQVSSKYGLERGEIDSGREHIEQERYKAVKAQEERETQEQAAQKAAAASREAEETREQAEKQAQEALQTAKQAEKQAAENKQIAEEQEYRAKVVAATAEHEECRAGDAWEQAEAAEKAAREATEKNETIVAAVQEAQEESRKLVGDFKKTITGKTIITPEQMETIGKLQYSVAFERNQRKRAEQETEKEKNQCYSWIDKFQQRGIEVENERRRADRAERELSRMRGALEKMPEPVRQEFDRIVKSLAKTNVSRGRGGSGRKVHMLKDIDDYER